MRSERCLHQTLTLILRGMGLENSELDRVVRATGGADLLVRIVKGVVVQSLQFSTPEGENELVSAVCQELLSSSEPITSERIGEVVKRVDSVEKLRRLR
jgi:hypothetical protein